MTGVPGLAKDMQEVVLSAEHDEFYANVSGCVSSLISMIVVQFLCRVDLCILVFIFCGFAVFSELSVMKFQNTEVYMY